jgi:phage-related tail protein
MALTSNDREVFLAEITALRAIVDERDRLYKERDDSRRVAVDAALAAVKDQTKASFEASEKAIVKAEEAQRAYNLSHNDLARKMDDQNKATMPRVETEQRFHAVEEKINTLRDSVATVGSAVSSQIAAVTSAAQGGKAVKDETRANLAIGLSFLGLIAGLLYFMLKP